MAYKEYANDCLFNPKKLTEKEEKKLKKIFTFDSKKITSFLQITADALSELTQASVFYLAPRFDQDLIEEVKIIALSQSKLLIVLITEFGTVRSEIVPMQKDLTPDELLKIEFNPLFHLKGESSLLAKLQLS